MPNVNPFAEARVQRTKHEVLDQFIVFGERHVRHPLEGWLAYYHEFRPHQGIGDEPISGLRPIPEDPIEFRREEIICRERLGGLLKHYERKAA